MGLWAGEPRLCYIRCQSEGVRCSATEVQSKAYGALDQRYIEEETFNHIYEQAERVSKLDSGLITYLLQNQSSSKPNEPNKPNKHNEPNKPNEHNELNKPNKPNELKKRI